MGKFASANMHLLPTYLLHTYLPNYLPTCVAPAAQNPKLKFINTPPYREMMG